MNKCQEGTMQIFNKYELVAGVNTLQFLKCTALRGGRSNKSGSSVLPWHTIKKIKGMLSDPVHKLMTCMSFDFVCALLNRAH